MHASQAYPDATAKIVVPLPAGGTADTVARRLADSLSKRFGQAVIVENRSGGGGSIGASSVARAKPDGLTLFFGSGTTQSVLPAVMDSLSYDPVGDFKPLMLVASSSYIFVTRQDFPATSFVQMMTYVKANPGKVSFGSFGAESASHLGLLLLQLLTKSEFLHVPYRGGAPVLQALMAGEVDAAFLTGDQAETINSGRIPGLAVPGADRLAPTPAIPSAKELGLAEWTVPVWNGLFAPARTPADRCQKVIQAAHQSLAEPEFINFLTKIEYKTDPSSNSESFAAYLSKEVAAMKNIVLSSGFEKKS